MSTMLSTRLPSKLTGSGRMGMRADGAAITASCQDPSRLFSSTGLPKRLKKDHTSGTRSDQITTSVGQLINLKTNLMTSLLRREAIARNDIAVSGPTEHCPIFHFRPFVRPSSVTGVTY